MQATAQAFEQFKKAEKDEAAKPDDKRLKENTKKVCLFFVCLKTICLSLCLVVYCIIVVYCNI